MAVSAAILSCIGVGVGVEHRPSSSSWITSGSEKSVSDVLAAPLSFLLQFEPTRKQGPSHQHYLGV